MNTVFLRAIEQSDKAAALLLAIHSPDRVRGIGRFDVDPESFSSIPGCPFVYQVPQPLLDLASNGWNLAAIGAVAHQGFGASTRFHRLAWEGYPAAVGTGTPWLWLAHGTRPSPFYKPSYHLVRWADNGHEAKAEVVTRYPYLNGNYGFKIQAEEYYGRPGLCYGKRTGFFTVQTMPPGHAFSFEGTAIHSDGSVDDLWNLLGLLNSRVVAFWLDNVCAQHKTYTYLNATPMPQGTDATLGSLALRGWRCQVELASRDEVGNYFVLPSLLRARGDSLAARAVEWRQRVQEVAATLGTIRAEIDERCMELYGIDEEDRRPIVGRSSDGNGSEVAHDEVEPEDDSDDEANMSADVTTLATELVSWAVGVAFGHFDVRFATNDRALPPEPEPFAPLATCSPGMLTDGGGIHFAHRPAGYPLSFFQDGILVDDPSHPRDVTAAVEAVFDVVFGAHADEVWQEAASLLDPRDHDLRRWLSSRFFDHHLRRYSKGRRKAPILWQLAVPSGRFSVWCYSHRMTRDSLFAIQNEVVASKLAHEERRRSSLTAHADHTPSARERAQISDQDSLLAELRLMLDEVRRAAPLWNPNFDDGIALVMAPLWRLVPTHKAWQRELRAKWDDLVAGKFDWAHVAMHLWPERVIPKCATDRSLAIAHDLEDVLWIEGSDGKWTPRSSPTLAMGELIAARTSPAVKAALASLRQAPALPTASETRHRKSG